MRRLVALLAFVALAWPATADAKEGAMFSPQLLTLLSGKATRVQLYVWPVISRGREVPAVGSIPVVRLRLVSGRRVLRFRARRFGARDRCIRWCGSRFQRRRRGSGRCRCAPTGMCTAIWSIYPRRG